MAKQEPVVNITIYQGGTYNFTLTATGGTHTTSGLLMFDARNSSLKPQVPRFVQFNTRLGQLNDTTFSVQIDFTDNGTWTAGPVNDPANPVPPAAATLSLTASFNLSAFHIGKQVWTYDNGLETGYVGNGFGIFGGEAYHLLQTGSFDPTAIGPAVAQPIPFTITAAIAVNNGAVSDTIMNGRGINFNLDETYTSLTMTQYLVNVAQANAGNPDLTVAENSLHDLTKLRQHDAGTSQYNIPMRDAEYWMFGYIGGLSVNLNTTSHATANQVFNQAIKLPAVSFAWNALKYLNLNGKAVDLPNLAGSAPGGNDAFLDGYAKGITHVPIQQAVANSQEFLEAPNLGSPLSPVMPPLSTPSASGELSFFDVSATGSGSTAFINASSQSQNVFGVSGNNLTGIEVLEPSNASGQYQLQFGAEDINLSSGKLVDLTSYTPGGMGAFKLTGPSLGNVVLGLQFSNPGETSLVQTVCAPIFRASNRLKAV